MMLLCVLHLFRPLVNYHLRDETMSAHPKTAPFSLIICVFYNICIQEEIRAKLEHEFSRNKILTLFKETIFSDG